MKIEPRRVGAFLKDPGACRVILLYGDDEGLIRERAQSLTRWAAGTLDDPFRVVELARDEAARLPDEIASLSLTGGRRVVRLRDATDAATSAVKAALAGPGEALVVIEGPGLSKSRLRTALEAAPDGAAIGCYPEDTRALADTIRETMQEAGIALDRDALEYLTSQLGADRAFTRQELDKLILYAGTAGRVDIEAATACVGDAAGLSQDDALFAATEGDVPMTDRALELAVAEGASPVGLLRAALGHLQRLHRIRLHMANGLSAADAARMARPPIFFRRLPAVTRALGLWSPGALQSALQGLADAERACKRTGAPDVVLSRNAILALARRAAQARGVSRG